MTENDTWRGLERMPERQLPYQLVAYGFVGTATEGNWVIVPQAVFRPTYLLVWGKDARLSSFTVAGSEQFTLDPNELLPVFAIQPALSPAEVLAQSLPVDRVVSLDWSRRVVLIGEPLRISPPVPCNGPFPTCSVGNQIRLEWQGELEALLIVGPQIL